MSSTSIKTSSDIAPRYTEYDTLPQSDAGFADDVLPNHLTTQQAWTRVVVPHFVPAWEGLRGICALAVVFSHCHIYNHRWSDFTGQGAVTIFFVLSGFLITGVLEKLQENANNLSTQKKKVNYGYLMRFYMDRTVRLYPALVTMIVTTGALHLWRRNWNAPNGFYLDVAQALLYINDFTIRIGKRDWTIWQNTWTLSCEEQYYIVWSLVLPHLLRMRMRLRILSIAIPALISLYLHFKSHTYSPGDMSILYSWNSPLPSMWAILMGSLARLAPLPPFMHSSRTATFALIALFLLGPLLYVPFPSFLAGFESYFQYRLWITPLCSICALLIITGTTGDGNRFLEQNWCRFLGRISYSFYLYPNPLQYVSGQYSGFPGVSAGAVGFVCAIISTLYIEEPIRERYRKWRQSSK